MGGSWRTVRPVIDLRVRRLNRLRLRWTARTGAQRRQLPDEYGKWNSVFRRYRHRVEGGVFDAMLETLAELAGRDRTADMINSMIVRAHHRAVGIKKGNYVFDKPDWR